MKLVNQEAVLRWVTPNPQAEIASAARLCYQADSKGKTDAELIQHVLSLGHESVLEHACASFQVVCDRGVSHEIVRHRLASYSQESTRYCNYAKDRFGGEISVSPMQDGLTEAQVRRRMALWGRIEQVYLEEIDEGVKPQQARDNLPTCLKTELRWTANFREWRLILKLRTSKKAHPQMRAIASSIGATLLREAPDVFTCY